MAYRQVSSTEIRSLTARGLSTRYLLSDRVVTYIKKNRLYQGRTSPRNSVVHTALVGYTHSPRSSVTGYTHSSRSSVTGYAHSPRSSVTGYAHSSRSSVTGYAHSPRSSVTSYAHSARVPGTLVVYTPPPRGGSTGDYEECDMEWQQRPTRSW